MAVLAFGAVLLACTASAPQPHATASAAPSAQERATVGGYDLELAEGDGFCTVSFANRERRGTLRLALHPPCRFVRRPDGPEVQSRSYTDAGNATVVIVAGHAPGDSHPSATDPFCGTRSQGLLLRAEQVTASARVAAGRKCTAGEDPQEFWLFGH